MDFIKFYTTLLTELSKWKITDILIIVRDNNWGSKQNLYKKWWGRRFHYLQVLKNYTIQHWYHNKYLTSSTILVNIPYKWMQNNHKGSESHRNLTQHQIIFKTVYKISTVMKFINHEQHEQSGSDVATLRHLESWTTCIYVYL